MSKLLLIASDGSERRVALVENGALAEVFIEREQERGNVGSIYKGRVARVLPGMQAAFVEIGLSRAAFLYAADARRLPELREDGENGDPAEDASRELPPIQSLVHERQELLVQVSKDPIGTKGARITTNISLPGRHLVLMPTVDHIGISRRILDEGERERLRKIVESIRPPSCGFIVRTVAEGQSEAELKADMEFLLRQWEEISQNASSASAPSLIYRDLDVTLRAVRDMLSDDCEQLLIDNPSEFARVKDFVSTFAPSHSRSLELYQGSEPLFDAYGVEVELDRALTRKVWLRSGGYLVIDQTEALTSIDVNTGRFVGYRNLEDTISKTNLEAVKEVVDQLRIRNIGGLIIIDFIDMEREADRQKVWRTLQQALQADRARTNVLEISELGLVEMTRKRVRPSLNQQLTDQCPYCEGRGYLKSAATVSYDVLREIRRQAHELPGDAIIVAVHPDVADRLAEDEPDYLAFLEQRLGKEIVVDAQADFHIEQFEIHVKFKQ
ncbi:MAG: Rne/Rng family ribonuclease [Deltaproteobacteria bacterium]|nr:Rne/Rng family ribonuclease [Deltaproteobacteria bacterium]